LAHLSPLQEGYLKMACYRNCFPRKTFRRSRRLTAASPSSLVAIGWTPRAALFCLGDSGSAGVLPLPRVTEGAADPRLDKRIADSADLASLVSVAESPWKGCHAHACRGHVAVFRRAARPMPEQARILAAVKLNLPERLL
jgi:hypothetical protein